MGKKIKVGILGLGRAGFNMHRGELERLPELFTIVAGADPFFSQAEERQKRCDTKPYHRGSQETCRHTTFGIGG
jgi:predicted dehydrogenase